MMTSGNSDEVENGPSIQRFKAGDRDVYCIQGYETPEDLMKVVDSLQRLGTAKDFERVFSPYSSLVRMTIDKCNITIESDMDYGVHFYSASENNLDNIVNVIQNALS